MMALLANCAPSAIMDKIYNETARVKVILNVVSAGEVHMKMISPGIAIRVPGAVVTIKMSQYSSVKIKECLLIWYASFMTHRVQ